MRTFKPTHKQTPYRKTSRQRNKNQTGHKFYNSYASGNHTGWRGNNGIRATHLNEHPFCVECIKEGKPMNDCLPESPHVDHIEPHNGNWTRFCDTSNLQTLCHHHHSQKTAGEQTWT